MRHTNLKAKGSTATVINTADVEIELYKYTKDNGLVDMSSPEIIGIGSHYKVEISLPDEDCHILIKWGEIVDVIRVGYPESLVLFIGEVGESYSYKQYGLDGGLIIEGTLTEAGHGLYYYEPTNVEDSYYELNTHWITTYKVHSAEVVGGTYSGTIVLQPNRFQAIAIPVTGRKVNEYFLDKIAETVGADANTVINLVKSYPSSDASEKKFQVFVPGLTNPDSSTNFELVQTDGVVTEITPFYVQTKEFPEGMDTIEFTWDIADAV